MIIFKALKQLLRYYFNIIPTYIFVGIIKGFFGNMIPVFGRLLVLPFNLSVTHAMLSSLNPPTKSLSAHFQAINKNSAYLKNIYYLFIKHYLYHIPFLLGVGIYYLLEQLFNYSFYRDFIRYLFNYNLNMSFFEYLFAFNYNYYIIPIIVIVFFAIPSIILSLMVAMIPYILADDSVESIPSSVITASATMLKGHYVRLFLTRLLFLPWAVWFVLGSIPTALFAVMLGFAQGPLEYSQFMIIFILAYVISLFIHLLFVKPLYMIVHAVFYQNIKRSN